MSEEILFGSDGVMSARESHYYNAIEKTRDNIIKACKKCDNGFIMEKNGDPSSLDSFTSGVAKECSCRVKALWISKLIYSGIPRQFTLADDIDLPFDVETKDALSHYIGKIDKAHAEGLGILFCPVTAPMPWPQGATARQAAAMAVLLSALKRPEKFTAHYIDMNNYINLQRKTVNGEEVTGLLDEINAVDFLCIDHMGNSKLTEFQNTNFISALSDRVLNRRPTILISNKHYEKIKEMFDEQIMDLIVNNCARVMIKRFDKKVGEFANIKGRL